MSDPSSLPVVPPSTVPLPTAVPRPAEPSQTISLARFLASTRAEGPGERTAVWVQGCGIRCPGCFNPQMWSFRGGEQVTPAELAERIIATGTPGLTLLGGEPFDQAATLAEVARRVRLAGRSVMTFTGYPLAQLRGLAGAGRADVAALFDQTDLLVAGPFLRDRVDTRRPWVGSTNQEFVLLNDRFPELLDELSQTPDRVEISVDATGRVEVNGWAEPAVLDELLHSIRHGRSTVGGRSTTKT